jgi:hypothetical protein
MLKLVASRRASKAGGERACSAWSGGRQPRHVAVPCMPYGWPCKPYGWPAPEGEDNFAGEALGAEY